MQAGNPENTEGLGELQPPQTIRVLTFLTGRAQAYVDMRMHTPWQLILIFTFQYFKRNLAGGFARPRPPACIHMRIPIHRQLIFIFTFQCFK